MTARASSSRPSVTKRRIAAALLLLLAGVIPYVLWRHDAIFLAAVCDWLPSAPALAPSPLATWILYSFSDGAWYAALLTCSDAFRCTTRAERILRGAIIALPFALEGLQYTGAISGTADIADLLTYTAILIIYLTYIKMRKLKLTKTVLSQAALLLAFAAVAMASGSSYKEGYDYGSRVGTALAGGETSQAEPEIIPADSIQIIPGAELADNR